MGNTVGSDNVPTPVLLSLRHVTASRRWGWRNFGSWAIFTPFVGADIRKRGRLPEAAAIRDRCD
jgi:hypothetical protein